MSFYFFKQTVTQGSRQRQSPHSVLARDRMIFDRVHFFYPLLALWLVTVLIETWSLDMNLADWIYRWEGSSWALRDAWITSDLLHKGGHFFSLLLLVSVLALLVGSYCLAALKPWRKTLWFVLLAAGGGSLLVSILKALTHVSCPWDFSRYGGKAIYQSVFTQILSRDGGRCFPAGHASAGYAWVALYFVGVYHQSRLRWLGLAFALTLGLAFGIAQQLRGAHFISHDIWTLATCWLVSFAVYRFWLVKPYEQDATADASTLGSWGAEERGERIAPL